MNSETPRRPASEFPSPDKQRIMGEFLFLAMRSELYRGLPLARFREAFEPAIDKKQFQIYRFEEVPRGLLTWARLTEDAERRFVNGEGLSPDDWDAGDRFWIVDLIAPYKGIGSMMAQRIRRPGNLPTMEYRYVRADAGSRSAKKIVHVNLDAPNGRGIRVESASDY